MTTASIPPQAVPPASRYVVPRGLVRRCYLDEYHRMIRDGHFAADERFELLDGQIVPKTPRDPLHDACLARARRLIDMRLPPGWHVRVQSAATIADSEPEPDLAVVRGEEFDYLSRHPRVDDTALVVEIANTSAPEDRSWKGALYARAGFAVYWLIDLTRDRVEAYTDPVGADESAAYRRREDYQDGKLIPLSVDAPLNPLLTTNYFPRAPNHPRIGNIPPCNSTATPSASVAGRFSPPAWTI